MDRPRVHLEIRSTISAAFPGEANSTYIVLVVVAKNAGTPTILDNWRLRVRIGQDNEIEAQPLLVPETLVLHGPMGVVVYKGTDAIYDKSVTAPVPRGGQVAGILQFRLPAVPIARFHGPSTLLRLSCSDVLGKRCTLDQTLVLPVDFIPEEQRAVMARITFDAPIKQEYLTRLSGLLTSIGVELGWKKDTK